MTRSSPASAVTMPSLGAVLIEETGLKADMKMRAMNFKIARAARLSGQPVKAGGSYAPEALHRAVVAGSGQAELYNSGTWATFVLSNLYKPNNIWALMISQYSDSFKHYFSESAKTKKKQIEYSSDVP